MNGFGITWGQVNDDTISFMVELSLSNPIFKAFSIKSRIILFWSHSYLINLSFSAFGLSPCEGALTDPGLNGNERVHPSSPFSLPPSSCVSLPSLLSVFSGVLGSLTFLLSYRRRQAGVMGKQHASLPLWVKWSGPGTFNRCGITNAF